MLQKISTMKELLNCTNNNLFWTTSCCELTDFCREVFSRLDEKVEEASIQN